MPEIRWAQDRVVTAFDKRTKQVGVLVQKRGNDPVEATLNIFYGDEGIAFLSADEMDELADILTHAAAALRLTDG